MVLRQHRAGHEVIHLLNDLEPKVREVAEVAVLNTNYFMKKIKELPEST